jgi:peptide chain release factor 1
MFARLKQAALRYRELEAAVSDPEIASQPARLSGLLREMGALRSKAETYERWAELKDRQAKAIEMQADPDAEMHELAKEELTEVDAALAAMEQELRLQIADDDPNRGRNVILELRAGTGGDEASLFVADLVRIYTKFADANGCKVEPLGSQPTEVGGYKEVILGISGAKAWELFRYEGGGHRVQRVPETETQGRIHTSAATVAVLAEVDEQEVDIAENDLRIDTFRSSGPGGQSVNKTSSAIRITHIPSGVVVQCQDESSQHKNKSKAMRMLRSRLGDKLAQERKSEEDSQRRTQIGSGDRSERIRTYNFPQNRVTDHRIKTSYSLETVALGHLEPVVEDLHRHDLESKLSALGEGAS